MDESHNVANEIREIDTAVKNLKREELTLQQQAWVDYNALSGIVTDLTSEHKDASGSTLVMRKMTIIEFADKLGVDRQTLRRWRESIPNFWEKVNARRKELAPQARLQRIHETWYLKAAALKNWQITEAWLINFDPNYKQPRMKVEHDITESMADALGLAKRRRTENIQEGEIVKNDD